MGRLGFLPVVVQLTSHSAKFCSAVSCLVASYGNSTICHKHLYMTIQLRDFMACTHDLKATNLRDVFINLI